jgi:ABC-type phosphate transport system permease subunit
MQENKVSIFRAKRVFGFFSNIRKSRENIYGEAGAGLALIASTVIPIFLNSLITAILTFTAGIFLALHALYRRSSLLSFF